MTTHLFRASRRIPRRMVGRFLRGSEFRTARADRRVMIRCRRREPHPASSRFLLCRLSRSINEKCHGMTAR